MLDPFTGEPVKALGPVLTVKIDNIVDARPQTGLQSADLIYVIPVEGGLTRLMAVYSSRIPPVVGPVRSARQSEVKFVSARPRAHGRMNSGILSWADTGPGRYWARR